MATSKEIKLAQAALKCASEQTWKNVTLAQIAKAAKIPLRQVEDIFPDTLAVLSAIVQHIDSETLKAAGKMSQKDSLHDRLFTTLMARFDVLQQHRKAVLSIINTADPLVFLTLLEAHWQSAETLLIHVKLSKKKAHSPQNQIALLLVYYATFLVWKNDKTKDLSKTMAALDRYLSYAEKARAALRA